MAPTIVGRKISNNKIIAAIKGRAFENVLATLYTTIKYEPHIKLLIFDF